MNKGQVSIIIPSRNGMPYTQKTVDSLLSAAEGDIEVIVVLDGIWAVPPIKDHPRVRIIHHGIVHDNLGMRESINKGVAVSNGEYIMKIDEQCNVDQGFDTKLKADCDDNWVVIPRRMRLDWDTWENIEDGRPPVDYMYLAYPFEKEFDKTQGLHGAEWRERQKERVHLPIDDTMSWQGSSYFMKRSFWDKVIVELDSENYGTFTQEAQEIGNKTWLSGGRLVVNKKTWYSHGHKGKRGKGYGFSEEQYKRHMEGTERGRLFCIDYWTNDKHLLEHPNWKPFKWLIEKFWPVPTWPENWQEQIKLDQVKDYSNSPEKKDWYTNNIGGQQ